MKFAPFTKFGAFLKILSEGEFDQKINK